MTTRHLRAGMATELARGPVYYLAGPPGMVRGLTEMLDRAGVVDGDIRPEEFSGY
jgi:Na+-transporting NADH:ubiquinone oxidoreductase subunit NqrF